MAPGSASARRRGRTGRTTFSRPRTARGDRLASLLAKMLRESIGERKSGLLFPLRTGRPLHHSDILRRVLHPILAKLGQPKCGVDALCRFRNAYLRNYTSTPPGVYRFWMRLKRPDSHRRLTNGGPRCSKVAGG